MKKFYDWRQVKLTGGFLAGKQRLNREVTMDAVYERFTETGRIAAFGCDWREGNPFRPHIFWDSDVAKWMEAAAYILYHERDDKLEKRVEDIIDQIEKNRRPDGYFNVYYTAVEPSKRFSDRTRHELYCAGHLIEAAVAYAEATGRTRFLHICEDYVDCIRRAFVEEKTARFSTPGHEEIELALIRLYRFTGKKEYLDLALHFLNCRGISGNDFGLGPDYDWEKRDPAGKNYDYNQSHMPVRLQRDARGHSVRAAYLYCAMADAALEASDGALSEACDSLYADITERKMYVTGGIGSTNIGEAFTNPYDLPNAEAYTETCAAIGLVFFSQRMTALHDSSVYSDVIERALYNGILSGLSADGERFFYENPLEITLNEHFSSDYGARRFPLTRRPEIFSCSCCPPNINRLLASLGGYLFSSDGDTLFIEQFADSVLIDGDRFCRVRTDYPVSGEIAVSSEGFGKIALRVPGWCRGFRLNVPFEEKDGYAVVSDTGDDIVFNLEMPVFPVRSNVLVSRDAGKLAVARGPVVYCAESQENGENLAAIRLSPKFGYELYTDLLTGIPSPVIGCDRLESGPGLYADAKADPYVRIHSSLRMIPYCAFANREECDMRVWFDGDIE